MCGFGWKDKINAPRYLIIEIIRASRTRNQVMLKNYFSHSLLNWINNCKTFWKPSPRCTTSKKHVAACLCFLHIFKDYIFSSSMSLWKWNKTSLQPAVCFPVWQLLLDTIKHSFFFSGVPASNCYLIISSEHSVPHPVCVLLTILLVNCFSDPSCFILSQHTVLRKHPLKALKKRCKWVLFTITFKKLLMNISGPFLALTDCCQSLWVRECKLGTSSCRSAAEQNLLLGAAKQNE